MAKFPTEVERSVTVKAPIKKVYDYLWNVVGSSGCIPGLQECKRVGKDTYHFLYEERSAGPVSMQVCYTSKYQGNGRDEITFSSTGAEGDNTEVNGTIRLQASGAKATRITLRQMLAPDTPIPRLMQGLVKGFVEREAADAMSRYLENVKESLEA